MHHSASQSKVRDEVSFSAIVCLGDHRHLLYEDMDPCYDGKYCPDLQKSDMRDSVTEVTPYSIKDRADLMGLGLESGSDNDEGAKKKGNLTFLDNFDIPDWRDENYYATDSPKVNQFVRFVEADDYEDGERPRIWQKKWLIEDLMKSSGSSCPYANRLKMKRLQDPRLPLVRQRGQPCTTNARSTRLTYDLLFWKNMLICGAAQITSLCL